MCEFHGMVLSNYSLLGFKIFRNLLTALYIMMSLAFSGRDTVARSEDGL